MLNGKIEFTGKTLGDVRAAIEAAHDSIQRGNTSGFDRNEDGSYMFALAGEENAFED